MLKNKRKYKKQFSNVNIRGKYVLFTKILQQNV